MSEIEKAIEILSDFSKQVKAKSDGAYEYTNFIEAKKVAITALREKQEREKPCTFIHELYIEKHWAYCPHCGRKLVP